MSDIHPTSIIDPKAEIASGVKVGPYSIIGPDVKLGEGSTIHPHVVIAGRTTIGAGAQIYPFASIGQPPQDLKYRGEPSTLEIGANALIREYVTINPGTEGGGMVTKVGANSVLLSSSHIGHDCHVGDNVIISSGTVLAGHCMVGDFVIFGGLSAVHQFVRIGSHAFVGGATAVEGDVIPFGMVVGNRAKLMGLNLIGMKRRGFSREQMSALRDAYSRIFTGEGVLRARAKSVAEDYAGNEDVIAIADFVMTDTSRPLCLPG